MLFNEPTNDTSKRLHFYEFHHHHHLCYGIELFYGFSSFFFIRINIKK